MSAFNSGSIVTNFSGTLSNLQLTGNTQTVSTSTGTLIVGGGIGAQAINATSATFSGLYSSIIETGTSAGTSGIIAITQSTRGSALTIGGSEYWQGSGPTSGSGGIAMVCGVNRKDNKQLWIGDAIYSSTANTGAVLRVYTTDGTAMFLDTIAWDGVTSYPLHLNSTTLPSGDNSRDLGSSSKRWANFNAVNINSTKQTVSDLLVTSAVHLNGSSTATSLYLTSDIRSSNPNYFNFFGVGSSNVQSLPSGGTPECLVNFTNTSSLGNLYSALGGYTGILSVFYTGYHYVCANIRVSANATGYRQLLLIQNVQLSGGTDHVTGGTYLAEAVIPVNSATAVTALGLTSLIFLNSGDTLSLAIAQNSGSTLVQDCSVQNNFSIFRIA